MPLVIPGVAEVAGQLPSIWSIIPVDFMAPVLAYLMGSPMLMTFILAQAIAIILPIMLLSGILIFLITALVAISICVTLFWGVVGGILLVPLIIVFSVLMTVVWAIGALAWSIYAWTAKGQGPNQLLQSVPVVNKLQDGIGGIQLPNGVQLSDVPATTQAIIDGANKTIANTTDTVQSTVGSVSEKLGLGDKLGFKQVPTKQAQSTVGNITGPLGLNDEKPTVNMSSEKIKDEPEDLKERFSQPPAGLERKFSSPLNPTKLSSATTGYQPHPSEHEKSTPQHRRRRSSEHTYVGDNYDDESEPPLEGMNWDKPVKSTERKEGGLPNEGLGLMQSIERSLN